jgi:hypothetical protein
MSQIFAAQLTTDAGPISEALSKIVEDEQKRREMEAQDKTNAMKLTTMTWSGRPMMSNFCGLREADEDPVYLIAEIKNANYQCNDFGSTLDPPHRCLECKHRRPSRGKAEDLRVEETTAGMATRNVSVGLNTSVADSLLTTHREGVASRIGFELTGAYNSAGHLAMEPRYFDYCGHYSTPDDYVVCLMQNPHHTCKAWEATMPTETPETNLPTAPPQTDLATAPPPALATPAAVPAEANIDYTKAWAFFQKNQELVNEWIFFWEWMLDVEITGDDLKLRLAQKVIESLQVVGSPSYLQTLDLIERYKSVSALDEAQRTYQREQNQAIFVAMLRADPSPTSQGLLALYDAANPVLAAGPPPLTPETADCYLDLLIFKRAAVTGVPPQPADTQAKAAWRQKTSEEYSSMTQEMRVWIAQTPLILAGLRAKWATFSDPERAIYVRQWSAELGISPTPQASSPPPVPQQEKWSDAAPGTVDELLAQIMRHQEEEERHTAATNPELALQQRMQNASANAQMLSNIMASRHEASMAIIKNMR